MLIFQKSSKYAAKVQKKIMREENQLPKNVNLNKLSIENCLDGAPNLPSTAQLS